MKHFYRLVPQHSSLILDAVKIAERSNNIVLRFYESCGARGILQVNLSTLPKRVTRITSCNLNEDHVSDICLLPNVVAFELNYKPFRILTVEIELEI